MSKKSKDKGFLIRFSHEDHGADHFEVLWDSFRALFPKHSKRFEQLKLCNRIGDKLEEISVPGASFDRDGVRELHPGDQELLLRDDEFSKLKQMIEDEDIGWPQAKGKKVQAAIELIRAQKEIEVESAPVEESIERAQVAEPNQ